MLVERLNGSERRDGDVRLERFVAAWGGDWVPGRLTITRLHLSFLPNNTPPGSLTIHLSMRDIDGVEVTGGWLSKRINVRQGNYRLTVRVGSAERMAQRIVEQCEAAARQPDPGRRRMSRY